MNTVSPAKMSNQKSSTNQQACILCGSAQATLTTTVKAQLYKVWHCSSCDFTWVDRNDLKKPEAYPNYEDYSYNSSLRQSFERMKPLYVKGFSQRLDQTITRNRPLQELSFLDVGCASGEYLWTAREVGFGSVSGVEIDPIAAKIASEHGEVFTSAEQLTRNSYDVIQIKNVLSNIPDFLDFFESYLSLLKKDGVLLLDLLNQNSLTSVLRNTFVRQYDVSGRYGPLRPPYVINGFSKKSVEVLLKRYDMYPISLKTSYLGSTSVPYFSTSSPKGLIAKFLGASGSLIGCGSMLVSEAKFLG
jgi:2-polyprenyl-3-methyl-5-hydroxy-6-metoxy-1,4-benzoquinol methylase